MTPSTLVLKRLFLRTGDEPVLLDQALAFAGALRQAHGRPPSRLIIASAGELAVIADPSVQRFLGSLRRLYPGAEAHLAMQACLGLHAALLEAAQAPGVCLIVLIETPLERSQLVLDAAGIGGPNGFRAEAGIALLEVESCGPGRAPSPGEVIVESVHIYCQQRGLAGPADLVRRLTARLSAGAAAPIVSFATHSPWSRELARGFEVWGTRAFHPEKWLPSAEQDARHLLTLKPLVEIQQYLPGSQDGGLRVLTLGGGGRLGLLELARWRPGRSPAALAPLARFPGALPDDLAEVAALFVSGTADPARLAPLVRYIRKEQRGPDNALFTWSFADERRAATA